MCSRLIAILLPVFMCFLLVLTASAAYPRLSLVFDDIQGPGFEARSIRIELTEEYSGARQLDISIDEITVQNDVWKNLSVSCFAFHLDHKEVQCADGFLKIPGLFSVPVSLHFFSNYSFLRINLYPSKGERWQLTLQGDSASWQGFLAISNGQLSHFSELLPENEYMLQGVKGKISGTVELSGSKSDLNTATIDLSIDEAAFADQSGLHAGENIKLVLKSEFVFTNRHNQWQWRSNLYWEQGEVFWQPVYMIGKGHCLKAQGIFDSETIRLVTGSLMLEDMGVFDFSGFVDRSDIQSNMLKLEANKIAFSAFFDQVLKPFLRDTSFAEMEVAGEIDLDFYLQDSVLRSVSLDLNDGYVNDARQRFAFHRINAHIPWQSDGATIADINMLSGHILRIPLGTIRVPLEINQFDLYLPQLALPVLDGTLLLEDFSAAFENNKWQWQFNGELLPVSMDALTEALQIQQMHGELSGYIPKVSYDGTNVSVNGLLQVNIFDGSVVVHNLMVVEPMGLAPHLNADIAMRNLDLALLTRTFSFGKMEGRVDIDVNHLELVNWEPVQFDARLFSSPGDYSRRISQAAVENISALGGAGAMMAIQRSFLRFFEEFRYSEIGWRCTLRQNICHMGGIELEPLSRYTLVKGGGIPAITVMGYNHNVDWQELINRLQRITQENEPIIQ